MAVNLRSRADVTGAAHRAATVRPAVSRRCRAAGWMDLSAERHRADLDDLRAPASRSCSWTAPAAPSHRLPHGAAPFVGALRQFESRAGAFAPLRPQPLPARPVPSRRLRRTCARGRPPPDVLASRAGGSFRWMCVMSPFCCARRSASCSVGKGSISTAPRRRRRLGAARRGNHARLLGNDRDHALSSRARVSRVSVIA